MRHIFFSDVEGAELSQTLILGIGNTLLTDEAVGVQVVERLRERQADFPELRLLDGGTLSFTLIEDICAQPWLIVVDAARFGEPPGSVHCFEGAEMDQYLSRAGRSVHEVGLRDLLDIARLTERLPVRRALIGIEPHTIGWGEQLTPEVAPAVPKAAELALALIARWAQE